LLVALVMGLYAVAPAKDLPETRYDESQKLPYAISALSSAQVLAQSARDPRIKLKSSSSLHSWSLDASVIRQDAFHFLHSERVPRAPADPSPTIRYHVIRC